MYVYFQYEYKDVRTGVVDGNVSIIQVEVWMLI
jgi:hypothetical protein